MAVSKALLRLLRVRGLEEEQRKLALEAELSRLHRAEAALSACRVRERRARVMTKSGDGLDRQAALVELEAAQKESAVLERRRVEAERESERLRAVFLEKRTERRQAEALIEGARRNEETHDRQRAQQALDEWHASRGKAGEPRRQSGAEDEGNVSERCLDLSKTGKAFRL